jgi:hypothetical protein
MLGHEAGRAGVAVHSGVEPGSPSRGAMDVL